MCVVNTRLYHRLVYYYINTHSLHVFDSGTRLLRPFNLSDDPVCVDESTFHVGCTCCILLNGDSKGDICCCVITSESG